MFLQFYKQLVTVKGANEVRCEGYEIQEQENIMVMVHRQLNRECKSRQDLSQNDLQVL